MTRLSVLVLAALLAGCGNGAQSPTASNLTPGMAKKTIMKGKTTQEDVIKVFGPPDLVTHGDGGEVWTYDKLRYEVENSGTFLSVGVVGVGGTRAASSSTSTMLIIHFGPSDVVTDYRLSVAHF